MIRNKIVLSDSIEYLKNNVPDNSIDFIVSSPPYNLSINYDNYEDGLPLEKYLEWHEKVLRECFRVLKDDGRMAWQVGSITIDSKYFPLNSWVSVKLAEIGMNQMAEIVWNKSQITKRTAWGEWLGVNNNLLPPYEYVELFYKKSRKKNKKGESGIKKEEFIEWTNCLWNIAPESAMRVGHPAPFPEELVKRLLLLNTYYDDLVLDPFVGSGTTAVVCSRLGRDYIGIDQSEQYVEISMKRINYDQNNYQLPLF